MIFALYCVLPGPKHPDVDRVGVTYVNCWLRVRSFMEAKDLAEKKLRGQHWQILELEEIRRISRGHYHAGDEGLANYEQALIGREAYETYVSPKYPAYCVDFEAVPMRANTRFPKSTRADVKYWVMNEKVSSTADAYDDFWGKETHVRKAISLGHKAIKHEKWRVTAVGAGRPVNFLSYRKDPVLTRYYEEAEEYGECLSFWYVDPS